MKYISSSEKTALAELQKKYSLINDQFLAEEVVEHFRQKNDDNEESIKVRESITEYLLKDLKSEFDSLGIDNRVQITFTPLVNKYNFYKTHVPVDYVNTKNELNEKEFIKWQPQYENAEFIQTKEGITVVSREPEKNVQIKV